MIDYRLHPFIVIKLYKALSGRYGRLGGEILRCATRVYGAQRGRRMAARALRDGVTNLNFAAYLAYLESTMPPDVLELALKVEQGYLDDRITKCPWNEMWIEHDCLACGQIFCREIDTAVIHGMNPDLEVKRLEIMPDTGRCLLHLVEPDLGDGFFADVKRLKEGAKGPLRITHEFLTANLWYSYGGTIRNALAGEAEIVLGAVKKEIAAEYGQRLIDRIEAYSGVDFDSIHWEGQYEA
jgi:hypothetical protein